MCTCTGCFGQLVWQCLQRAEHNEGILATLEEVSLHQQDIERIEALGQLCRHLKILYLQSNLISKLQDLHKLKVAEAQPRCMPHCIILRERQACWPDKHPASCRSWST